MNNNRDCDEIYERAYHEAGHIVFASFLKLSISSAIIWDPTDKDDNQKPTAHTDETRIGKCELQILKLFYPKYFIIYYLSGGEVENFYFKNNKKHTSDEQEIKSCRGDKLVLRKNAKRYIDDKLSNPRIRAQIEGIANLLLDKKWHYNFEFKTIMDQQNCAT